MLGRRRAGRALFGTIQVLINNAALGFPAKQAALPLATPFPFWTHDPDDIIDRVKVNLLDTGVTANILLPGGSTDTTFVPGKNVGARAKPFAAGKGLIGQEGTDMVLLPPAIMAPPILWLASDDSNGITGRRFAARLGSRS